MTGRIEKMAEFSVARGCGFAGLGIFIFMAGLSFDMPLALKTAGLLLLLTCMVLVLKAVRADQRPYRSTELWILLAPQDRPGEADAQQVIARVLRATYLRFAIYSAAASGSTLAMALALAMIRSRTGG